MKKIIFGLCAFLPTLLVLPVFAVDEPVPDLTSSEPASTQTLPTNTTPTLTNEQKSRLIENCGSIRAQIKNVQKSDAKIRVELGDIYDRILSHFITPFNIRLVENNLSDASLVENQNSLVEMRLLFSNDFISYQQKLEELATINCEREPEHFYEILTIARARREIMAQDVLRMRSLVSENIKLTTTLKGEL